MSSITQLVFPSDLSDSAYENRKVIFYATSKDLTHEDLLAQEVATDINSTAGQSYLNTVLGAGTSTTADTSDDTIQAQITLPLPNSINDSQDHSWNTEEGFLGTMYSNVAGREVTAGAGSLPGIGGLVESVSGFSIDKTIGMAAQKMGTRRPTVNPGYWQNYTGSKPRTFAMSYEFLPKSQEEAAAIRNIILLFKTYSSPSAADSRAMILMAPYYWQIKISNQAVSDLFNMASVVITNMSIDYGGDSMMQLFQDGFPKQINMTLQLAETSTALANNYANAYNYYNSTDEESIQLNQYLSASSLLSSYTSAGADLASLSSSELTSLLGPD